MKMATFLNQYPPGNLISILTSTLKESLQLQLISYKIVGLTFQNLKDMVFIPCISQRRWLNLGWFWMSECIGYVSTGATISRIFWKLWWTTFYPNQENNSICTWRYSSQIYMISKHSNMSFQITLKVED